MEPAGGGGGVLQQQLDERATSAGLSPQPGTGRPAGQLADLPIYIFVYHVYVCGVGQSGLRQKKRETER